MANYHLPDAAFSTTVAHRLMEEHRLRLPFAGLGNHQFSIDEARAYDIQREFVELRAREAGAVRVGYKIGLTSRAMQDLCGIQSPITGVILSTGLHSSPAQLSIADFGRLGLEFEIAMRVRCDIVGRTTEILASDIATSVDGVCAAIEIIDDRACDYSELDAVSLIADNAWNAGVVLSPFVAPMLDLSEREGVAYADAREIGRGFGRDVLGNPFNSLAWLANHLAAQGKFLHQGDIVMTGSMVKTSFPTSATAYEFECGELGNVRCEVNF